MKTKVAPIQIGMGLKASLLAWGLLLAATLTAPAQSLQIVTVAGYAGGGSAGGTGSGALFANPQGVALDGAGNLYVADTGSNVIRVVTSAGVSTILAGHSGASGSADGTGTNAFFNQPVGLVLDTSTNVYVSDYGNHTIRKITPAGVVTTIAGTTGVSGANNATGINATFFHPMGLGYWSGIIFVADYGNHLIRKISANLTVSTFVGVTGSAGYVDSANGTPLFNEPEGIVLDASGVAYVADTGNAAIRKITSAGVVTTMAGSGLLGSTDGTGTNALFYQPIGITVNASGVVYVADAFNNDVRKLTSSGVSSTIAGTTGIVGSSDGAGLAASFNGPQGIVVSSSGTLYVADSGNGTIRAIDTSSNVTTFAGSPSIGSANGATSTSRFYNLRHVAVDVSGNVYVADTQNSVIRKITPLGVVSIFAGTLGVFGSQDGTGTSALFSGPQGLAVDTSGNVYVADTGNATIRKITSAGTVSTLAGLAGNPGNADGTGTGAQFNEPKGLAVDSAQNVYVADTWNHVIRKVTSGGVSSTIAGLAGTAGSFDGTNTGARFNCPTDVAVDGSGNLYVADYYNHTIRKVTSSGVVTTLAGFAGVWGNANGTSNAAQFFLPSGVTLDSSSNIYVADSGNDLVRKVTQAGVVTTVAGLADVSGSLDGTGTAAEFNYPASIAFSPAGYLYVADSGNNTVRSQSMPPIIVTPPQSQTNAIGAIVYLSVAASGSTPFTYIWHANGTNYAASASSILAVSNAGTYTVTVTNIAGSALSSGATVTLTNAIITGAPGVFQNIYTLAGSGSVRLNFSGTTNANYHLQVSTNLITWSNILAFTMTNGAVQYTDSGLSNYPARFYRLVSP